MKLSDVVIGDRYTYYPKQLNETDNLHFPAIAEKVTKCRVRCRVFMGGGRSTGRLAQRQSEAPGASI